MPTFADDLDTQVRLAAFSFLDEQTKLHGDVLDRALLLKGFLFDGHPIHLISPQQGIFKPALMQLPISILTAPADASKDRAYDDSIDYMGRLSYCYRGKDPLHRDNVGLRTIMKEHKPLIYMWGVVPGRYMPVWPAYVVNDNPAALTFTVEVDDPAVLQKTHSEANEGEAALRRHYVTTQIQQRVHQRSFRERVLRAYQEQCAICRLRHQELLDAAHILPDGDPRGEPIVSNGLALCNLHHAAYDRNILGITPQLKVDVRLDILEEKDGPMLQWGLQHFHGADLYVPRRTELQPNPEFLADRYAIFQHAH
jgi:putative restriction endonuclease